VVGGANNQLAEPADAVRLMERNILYAPDYAVNIGGAMAVIGLESMGWSRPEAEDRVRSVKETLREIFERAEQEGLDTETAARRMAESRLAARSKRARPFVGS
jgi:glutamate dehydrogenase/leucine dehydrogenase